MDAIYGLDRRALDRARLSRDPRFDGKFFIAVTSTGIYCRPICPSPTSKSANVRYYPTAAAAAEAGFRPCLRCRPEAAPGTPAWLGSSVVVRRALRLIQDGALDEASVDSLAARIGVGPRHLHRLFLQHVGASPTTVNQTRRLHFAKRLVDETDLPLTEVALAAGFGSVRRFNDAFKSSYRRSPRELRRQRRKGQAIEQRDEVAMRLSFRPPYDWALVSAYLAERALDGVERVDRLGYARTVATDGGHAFIHVRPLDATAELELRVRGAAPGTLFQLSSTVRRMFDLAADPALIAQALGSDPLLAPLVKARPGCRIPGAWDPFECAVRAVLGESGGSSVSSRASAARLVAAIGQAIPGGGRGLTHLFPTAAALAETDLTAFGIAGARATSIRALAQAVASGATDLRGPPDETIAALTALPGVGERTAQYVALRALAEPDAFPAGDRALVARASTWRPWRGYAAVHLWTQKLESAAGRDVARPVIRMAVAGRHAP
jgi:AraC family transcriptional regulator, regulatory protein of adaptative response / DNA-3-methyladenine glycosylase II